MKQYTYSVVIINSIGLLPLPHVAMVIGVGKCRQALTPRWRYALAIALNVIIGYDDGITDLCYTFRDWAEYFATERSVELYDMLVEAKREIKHF